MLLQDSRTKSQGVSVTAFQSVPADESLSPAPSLLAGRLPSMDADLAQAIQLSLAGQYALRKDYVCATSPNLCQSNDESMMKAISARTGAPLLIKRTTSGAIKAVCRIQQGVHSQPC